MYNYGVHVAGHLRNDDIIVITIFRKVKIRFTEEDLYTCVSEDEITCCLLQFIVMERRASLKTEGQCVLVL